MADKRKDEGAGAAGGTLKDEAASGGEEPVSFGGLLMQDFSAVGEKEPSGMEEAISSNFILSGSHGKNEISEILARREGDGEMFIEESGGAKTFYQHRVLEAARAAREEYLRAKREGDVSGIAKYGAMLVRLTDALRNDGLTNDPEVAQMIHEDDDENSVFMDGMIAGNVLNKMGIDPRGEAAPVPSEPERARDIGGEIDEELGAQEGGRVPGSELHDEAYRQLELERIETEEEEIREEGFNIPGPDAETPAQEIGFEDEVIDEGRYEGAGIEEIAPQPPPLPEAQENDDSIDGRVTDVPPAPQKIGQARDELRRQADALDMLAGEKASAANAAKDPLQPKRPQPIRRSRSPPKAAGDVDAWVAAINEQEEQFFDKGDSGAFTAHMVGDVVRVDKLYRKEGTTHVMGISGDPSKRREKTVLGMPAASAEAIAGAEAEVEGDPSGTKKFGTQILSAAAPEKERGPAGLGVMGRGGAESLSRTSIFGQFENDPEMERISQEGSGALDLEHIRELSGARPVAAPGLEKERFTTGQLPAVSDAVNRIAGLGGTNLGMPAAAAQEDAPEVPPYGVDPDAGEDEVEGEGEAGSFDPSATAVVTHQGLADSKGNGGPKVWGEVAFGQTRLSSVEGALKDAAESAGQGVKTRNEKPREDFSIYGDVFYAVEKVFMESSGVPPSFDNMNDFPKMLTDAINKAELLSTKAELKKGETALGELEDARAARLKQFRTDFFEIEKGKEEPKKGFLAYNEWLANKRREYSDIRDVHELLSKALAGDLKVENKHGVSPGEYGRVAVLRLCNAAIKKGTLSEPEEAKVEKLREMLEPIARGEKDIYAQTIAADAAYEMIVGFATKRERARTRQLEQELGRYKLTVEEYEGKREVMVKILAEVLVSVKNSEADSGKAKDKVKQAIMALAPDDAFERGRYLRLIMDAQAGKGGKAGEEIRAKAERLAAETMDIPPEEAAKASAGVPSQLKAVSAPVGVPQKQGPTQDELRAALYGTSKPRQPKPQAVPTPKQHGPVASGIGYSIAGLVGAGLVVGTLLLNEYGIIKLRPHADATEQKPVAAQVEKVAEETPDELPAGTTDAGKDSAEKDAGVDPLMTEVGDAQPEQPPVAQEKYTRDKAGLKMALDDWCKRGEGLLVSGEMLRASYAAIEGKLDGKSLPQDAEWVALMLGMKFPNRVIELSVMSDIARGSCESDDVETMAGLLAEKYAAYMRLSILLGNRAGNPKGFETTVEAANKKGMGLPKLDKESHVGKIEALKVGERCLFSAYHETVMVTMAAIMKEATESGISKAEFLGRVHALLGENAERIESLAKDANFEANFEERRDYCRALTGGKRGAAALDRAGIVTKKWAQGHKRAKAEDARYQKSVDAVLGSAPKAKTNAPKQKAHKEKQPKPAASDCAGLTNNLDYLNCQFGGKLFKQQLGVDTGEKAMPKPKGKEAGSVSKAPRFVRY